MHPHAHWLGVAGLTPFWGLPLLAGLGLTSVDTAMTAFLGYSAIILSFLGGIHWYASVIAQSMPPQTYTAMLPSIVAWLALVLFSPGLALLVLPLGFVALLIYDFRTLNPPPGYWNLRGTLTTVAVLCHGWMALIH
ncbi:DUF3429 domain-containing protein [Marinobacter hydrocarbonoclasticus]|nr:DUF3429 domain-containing protein [Marinobacter nauticus]